MAVNINPIPALSKDGEDSVWAFRNSQSGVKQLLAGSGITLSPASGLGAVTVTSTGGGGGAVASVSGSGAGISVTPTTGAVVVSNTGATSIVAGTNVTISSTGAGGTGAVTINATGGGGGGAVSSVSGSGVGITVTPTTGAVVVTNSQPASTWASYDASTIAVLNDQELRLRPRGDGNHHIKYVGSISPGAIFIDGPQIAGCNGGVLSTMNTGSPVPCLSWRPDGTVTLYGSLDFSTATSGNRSITNLRQINSPIATDLDIIGGNNILVQSPSVKLESLIEGINIQVPSSKTINLNALGGYVQIVGTISSYASLVLNSGFSLFYGLSGSNVKQPIIQRGAGVTARPFGQVVTFPVAYTAGSILPNVTITIKNGAPAVGDVVSVDSITYTDFIVYGKTSLGGVVPIDWVSYGD